MKSPSRLHCLHGNSALLLCGLLFSFATIAQAETFTFNATNTDSFLDAGNWSGDSGGTATPAAMASGDSYVVAATAVLSGAAELEGGLVLNGSNSLTVAATGSLSLDGGSVTGSGTLTVNGLLSTTGVASTSTISCPLVLDNAGGRVLQISSGTQFQKSGAQTWTAGEVMVSGEWFPGQNPLIVPAGKTLAGDGLIYGDVHVYGHLEPGPDSGYGTLNITGSLRNFGGSTTEIEVSGNGSGEFDRIAVNVQAFVAGTLLVDFTSQPLADIGTYEFLTAGAGISFSYAPRTTVELDPILTFGYLSGSPGQFTVAIVPETFTFNGNVDQDFLNPANWTGDAGGAATPANMLTKDTYVVANPSTLAGSAELDGTLAISSGVTLTISDSGALTQISGSHVMNSGILSNAGSYTLNGATGGDDPTTLSTGYSPTGFVNQAGGNFLRQGAGDSLISGGFSNHGSFTDSSAGTNATWNSINFSNEATGVAVIRGRPVFGDSSTWSNAGTFTAHTRLGDPAGGSDSFVTNSGTMTLNDGNARRNTGRLVNTGTLHIRSDVSGLQNSGTVNLTGATQFSIGGSSTPNLVNEASGSINQAAYPVTFGDSSYTLSFRSLGSWLGTGQIKIHQFHLLEGTLNHQGSWSVESGGTGTVLTLSGILSGAALTVPAATTFTLSGGTIGNATTALGVVPVTADSNISGTLTLDPTSEMTINNGVTLSIVQTGAIIQNSGSHVNIVGTLSNGGDFTLNTSPNSNDPTILDAASASGFINEVSGNFLRTGSGESSITGLIINHGDFTDAATSGSSYWEFTSFDNRTTGTAIIGGAMIGSTVWLNAGTFTANSSLQSPGGSPSTQVTNSGDMTLNQGQTRTNGTLNNSGTLNVRGDVVGLKNSGTVNVTGALTLLGGVFTEESLNESGATINQGAHSVTLGNTFNDLPLRNLGAWTGIGLKTIGRLQLLEGILDHQGSWAFASGGAGTVLTLSGTLSGAALTVPAATNFTLSGGTIDSTVTSAADVSVTADSIISGSLILMESDLLGTARLTISGLLRTTGLGICAVACPITFNNPADRVLQVDVGSELEIPDVPTWTAGDVYVAGTLQRGMTVPSGAMLAGDGTISGALVVFGRVEPGPESGFGTLTVTENFSHFPGATTVIDVFGSGAGEFDRIVADTAETGGALEVNFSSRPLADVGTYQFLTANSHSSTYTPTVIGLHPNRSFAYDPNFPGQFTITSTVSPFEDWVLASGLTPGVNEGLDDDPNGDGKPNIQHFSDDTDPLGDGSSEGKQRVGIDLVDGSTYLTLTRPVRRGGSFAGSPSLVATVDGIIYTILGDDDLVLPHTLNVVQAGTTLGTDMPALRDLDNDGTADWEYQTFRLTIPIGSLERGFLQVQVDVVP